MADDLRIESFQNLADDRFRLAVPGQAILELRLSEVGALSPATAPPGSPRAPFSLLFHGPATPWADQGTYRLDHAVLGELELFLVPLGPDAEGMRYEAIFT